MLEIGDYFYIRINQGDRHAEVLAVIGDQALIEYYMPNGTTALRVIDRRDPHGTEYEPRGKRGNVSYFRLPKKWSRAMEEAGSTWYANPQQWNQVKELPEPY